MNVLKWMKNWVFLVVLLGVLVVVGVVVALLLSFTTALLVVGAIVATLVLWILIQWLVDILRARMMSQRLQSELENQPTYLPSDFKETTPGELKNKFRQSIQTLRQTLGKGFLYELPWFLLIGEAGSGKTTSLRKSNIRWPLGGEQQGIGGTVNCDWWFANEAVILDTAGRFAVHEKGSPVVPVWDNFLRLVKRVRPRKPIDGVVVAIPATSLIATEAERPRLLEEAQRKAKVLHDKLSEIQRKLQLVFPVWILVTKCDKIRGFEELCTLLPPEAQGSLVGWGNPGPLDQPFNAAVLDDIFAGVREDFLRLRTDILRDGETPENSDRIFLFPEELLRLRPVLGVYLEKLFDFSRYEEPHRFRGVFFSSGGQDQRPLSSLLEIERKDEPATKGPASQPAAAGAGTMMLQVQDDLFGRPYFVHDFYAKKVFQESGLCRPSRKVKDWMSTVQRVSQVAAVVLAVLGLGFFVWAFFAKSSAYDAINVQLEAIADRTEIPRLKDDPYQNRQPFWEYEEEDEKKQIRFNRLVKAYAVVQENAETIDGGPLEQIYLTLDRLLWLGALGVLEESGGCYVRSAVPAEGRFTDLPEEIQRLLDVRKQFRDLNDTGTKVHEIIALLEQGETLPDGLRPILQRFYRPEAETLEHETRFGRDDEELDEVIARRMEEVFREEDRALVGSARGAYRERKKPENLLLEKREEDETYVFATFGDLHDDAKAFGKSRDLFLEGSPAAAGQEALTFAVALRRLEAELKKVNAAFQAGKTTAKAQAPAGESEEDPKKELTAPVTRSTTINRILRGAVWAVKKADILEEIQKQLGERPQDLLEFLIDDGLRASKADPSLGVAAEKFSAVAAISTVLKEWEIGGDSDLESWEIEESEFAGLKKKLRDDGGEMLAELGVVVGTKDGGEQLEIRLHSSTQKLLTALGRLEAKVATDGSRLRMTPEDADRSLNGKFDDAKYIENLALNGPACKKLHEEVLKEGLELHKLFAEIENLDRLGADRPEKETLALNRRLIEGGKRLLVVHLWDGIERLPTLQGSGDSFSEDLAALLALGELDSYARTLDAAGWKSPKKLVDRLETRVRLEAERRLTQLRNDLEPHRAYLPEISTNGYAAPLTVEQFFKGEPSLSFFEALYRDEKRATLQTEWARKLKDYVDKGRKAFRFLEIVDPESKDPAFGEYRLVRQAFTEDLKVAEGQPARDLEGIRAHLSTFEGVRVDRASRGESLATLLEQLDAIEIVEPATGSLPFFQRQRRALLERARREARLFLAHKVIADANAFLDGFKTLCEERFPFDPDPFAPGVAPKKLFEFVDAGAIAFYAGKSGGAGKSFQSLVASCSRELQATSSSGFQLELEKLARDLDQSFHELAPLVDDARRPRKFSIFYWPKREDAPLGGSFGQQDLDLFYVKVPGSAFELQIFQPTRRNQLWADPERWASHQLLVQDQYTVTTFFGTNDTDVVRRLEFDTERIPRVVAASDLTVDYSDVVQKFPALGSYETTRQLELKSADAWYLLRFIRLFDNGKWKQGNRNQNGRGLNFLLEGNALKIPLRMTTREGKMVDFEHELVISFWNADDRDRIKALPAPDFHLLFEQFLKMQANRWTLDSLKPYIPAASEAAPGN